MMKIHNNTIVCLCRTIVALLLSMGLPACDTLVELDRSEFVSKTPLGQIAHDIYGADELVLRTHNKKPEIEGGLGPVCFSVSTIEIKGLEHVKTSEVEALVRPFAYKCQSGPTVGSILGQINGLHAERGLITTQAYLPEQNIKQTGKILIEVVAGRIEGLSYTEDRTTLKGWPWDRLLAVVKEPIKTDNLVHWVGLGLDKGMKTLEVLDDPLEAFEIFPDHNHLNAVPRYQDWVFDIERVQQGVDQVNSTSSASAAVKLEPGTEPGYSQLVMANTVRDSFRVNIGFDANGSEATGSNRLRIEVAKDNLIGFNDAWSASLLSGRNTNEVTGSFSIPYNWNNLTIETEYSEYLIGLSPVTELFGQSWSIKPSLKTTLLRRPKHKTFLTTSGKWFLSERYVNSTKLRPQRFTSLRVGLSEERTFDTWKVTYGAGASMGFDWFNSTKDPLLLTNTTPRAQFYKGDASINLSKVWKEQATLISNATGQWSDDPLYGEEQISMGSVSTLRGFKQAGFSADQGGTLTNNLSLDLVNFSLDGKGKSLLDGISYLEEKTGKKAPGWLVPQLKSFEPFVFVDVGGGRDLANDKEDLLASYGAGLKYKKGRFSAEATYGDGFYRKIGNVPDKGEVFVNLSYKVF